MDVNMIERDDPESVLIPIGQDFYAWNANGVPKFYIDDIRLVQEYPADDLLSYNLYKDGTLLTNTTSTNYTDTALDPGTYNYCVSAVYDEGESNQVCADVMVGEELIVPENFDAVVENQNDVNCTWDEIITDDLMGYHVYRDGEDVSGLDFTGFFDQWYFGEGFPVYNINWSHDENIFNFHSTQSASMPEITPFFNQAYPVTLYFNNGHDTTILINHDEQNVDVSFNLPETLDSVRIDPTLWILKKVAAVNGIKQVATKHKIHVSPNPAGSTIYLNTDLAGPFDVYILDMTGNTLLTVKSDEPNIKVAVQDLLPGVYLVSFIQKGKIYIRKFVKY